MRNPSRFARVLACAGMCVGFSLVARDGTSAPKVKNTANPPLPNVFLLVDTSGSMESMINGSDSANNADPGCGGLPSACSVTGTTGGAATCANRWGTLLQSLTGEFSNGYRCWTDDRNGATTSSFALEYQINGNLPYDYGYYLPYHRPVAQDDSGNNCAYGPYKLSDKGGSGSGVGGGAFGSNRQTVNEPDEFATDALALFAVGSLATPATKTSTANTTCTTYSQIANGAIDAGRDLVRFGLMTFDHDTNRGVGVSTPSPLVNLSTNPFTGQWSYFSGWDGATGWSSSWAQGAPANCSTLQDFEVGGRNPAAPMWEGRMVRFPDSASPLTDLQANNDNVQRALLASRPYGATPIQGMFHDARQYFWFDPSGPFKSDPYSQGNNSGEIGCRDHYIVLITDGTPNLDLEKACQQAGTPAGGCPFTINSNNNTLTETIVDDLAKGAAGTKPKVFTYVIGFAVDTATVGSGVTSFAKCSDMINGAGQMTSAAQTLCADTTQNTPGSRVEACCTLQKIAVNGGTGVGAYFADTAGDLNRAFAAILGQIVSKTSSRTVPTYAPVLNSLGNSFSVSSAYLASFDPTNPDPNATNATTTAWPWSGTIQRLRTICQGSPLLPVEQPITVTSADDFRQNLDSGTGAARNYITVQDQGASPDSTTTLRQYITANNDGLGTRKGYEVGSSFSNIATALVTGPGLSPYMGITSNCPGFTDSAGNQFGTLNAAECAKTVLSFAMGSSYSPTALSGTYNFNATFSRHAGNSKGYSALGAILHSNPSIAPPPAAQARDDSYRQFATINANRPHMMYVATIDGLLHAFDVTSDPTSPSATNIGGGTAINTGSGGKKNNEIWSFIPPAVLPALRSNYPGGQQNLLDGTPVVKDVVFARDATQTTLADKWHTAVVAGFGQMSRGYYALDVTSPIISSTVPWTAANTSLPATPTAPGAAATNPPVNSKGPHFLWQLAKIDTKAGSEVELFGKHSATPAIATLAFNDGGTVKEVGVAILPGGIDDGPFGECNRKTIINTHTASDATPTDDLWQPRTMVRKWANNCNDGVAGRSVTIVRLDNGEIIRTFGRYTSGSPTQNDIPAVIATANRATNADFDSPMTGTPIVYPGQVGAVAVKFFVGDADGTIWKFDVSDKNPANWKAEMFFDTFNRGAMASLPNPTANPNVPSLAKPNTAAGYADIGQPISILPVMSLDPNGNLVLHVATGDQDTFASTVFKPGADNDSDDLIAAYNFVYAITEKLDSSSKLRSSVNWYLTFKDGERVTGPMAIFDKTAYFATFAPGSTTACTVGEGRIWGLDFVNLATSCSTGNNNKGCGGAPIINATPGYIVPGATDTDLVGHLIAGVSIRATPPCADTSQINDTFAGGTYGGLSGLTSANFSLFASVATKATTANAATNQLGATFQKSLPQPKMATTIDSWAAIVE